MISSFLLSLGGAPVCSPGYYAEGPSIFISSHLYLYTVLIFFGESEWVNGTCYPCCYEEGLSIFICSCLYLYTVLKYSLVRVGGVRAHAPPFIMRRDFLYLYVASVYLYTVLIFFG